MSHHRTMDFVVTSGSVASVEFRSFPRSIQNAIRQIWIDNGEPSSMVVTIERWLDGIGTNPAYARFRASLKEIVVADINAPSPVKTIVIEPEHKKSYNLYYTQFRKMMMELSLREAQ